MASIDYPSDLLPSPLIDPYNYQEQSRFVTTEMDSGYRQKRKRFTKVPAIFNIELLMNTSKLSFFQAWFRNTLDSGHKWFNMDLFVGDGNAVTHECRALSEPRYGTRSNLHTVSFTIEAVEMQVGIDYDSVMESFIASLGGFDKASTAFDAFDTNINTTYPTSGYGPGA